MELQQKSKPKFSLFANKKKCNASAQEQSLSFVPLALSFQKEGDLSNTQTQQETTFLAGGYANPLSINDYQPSTAFNSKPAAKSYKLHSRYENKPHSASKTWFPSNLRQITPSASSIAYHQTPSSFTAPQHSQSSFTAPQHGPPSFTAPQHSQSSFTAPQHSQSSFTAPQHSQSSFTVPKHSQSSFTAPQHSQSSFTAPQHSQSSFTVPKHGPPSYTVLKHGPPSFTVPKHGPPSFTVPKHGPPSYTAPQHSQSSFTAPQHGASFTAIEHSSPSFTIPEHSPPTLTIPEHSPPTFSIPEHSPPTLSIPEHSPPTFSIPEHSPPTFSIPEHSPPTFSIPEHSPPTLAIPEHDPSSFTIPEHIPPSFTIPEHIPPSFTIPEHIPPSFTFPEHHSSSFTAPKNGHSSFTAPKPSFSYFTTTPKPSPCSGTSFRPTEDHLLRSALTTRNDQTYSQFINSPYFTIIKDARRSKMIDLVEESLLFSILKTPSKSKLAGEVNRRISSYNLASFFPKKADLRFKEREFILTSLFKRNFIMDFETLQDCVKNILKVRSVTVELLFCIMHVLCTSDKFNYLPSDSWEMKSEHHNKQEISRSQLKKMMLEGFPSTSCKNMIEVKFKEGTYSKRRFPLFQVDVSKHCEESKNNRPDTTKFCLERNSAAPLSEEMKNHANTKAQFEQRRTEDNYYKLNQFHENLNASKNSEPILNASKNSEPIIKASKNCEPKLNASKNTKPKLKLRGDLYKETPMASFVEVGLIYDSSEKNSLSKSKEIVHPNNKNNETANDSFPIEHITVDDFIDCNLFSKTSCASPINNSLSVDDFLECNLFSKNSPTKKGKINLPINTKLSQPCTAKITKLASDPNISTKIYDDKLAFKVGEKNEVFQLAEEKEVKLSCNKKTNKRKSSPSKTRHEQPSDELNNKAQTCESNNEPTQKLNDVKVEGNVAKKIKISGLFNKKNLSNSSNKTSVKPTSPTKKDQLAKKRVSNASHYSEEEKEKYFVPLKMGFHRNLRIRTQSHVKRGDIYYHPPIGPKLRSRPDVQKYLDKNDITDLTAENFCFSQYLIGYGLPYESEVAAMGRKLPSKADGIHYMDYEQEAESDNFEIVNESGDVTGFEEIDIKKAEEDAIKIAGDDIKKAEGDINKVNDCQKVDDCEIVEVDTQKVDDCEIVEVDTQKVDDCQIVEGVCAVSNLDLALTVLDEVVTDTGFDDVTPSCSSLNLAMDKSFDDARPSCSSPNLVTDTGFDDARSYSSLNLATDTSFDDAKPSCSSLNLANKLKEPLDENLSPSHMKNIIDQSQTSRLSEKGDEANDSRELQVKNMNASPTPNSMPFNSTGIGINKTDTSLSVDTKIEQKLCSNNSGSSIEDGSNFEDEKIGKTNPNTFIKNEISFSNNEKQNETGNLLSGNLFSGYSVSGNSVSGINIPKSSPDGDSLWSNIEILDVCGNQNHLWFENRKFPDQKIDSKYVKRKMEESLNSLGEPFVPQRETTQPVVKTRIIPRSILPNKTKNMDPILPKSVELPKTKNMDSIFSKSVERHITDNMISILPKSVELPYTKNMVSILHKLVEPPETEKISVPHKIVERVKTKKTVAIPPKSIERDLPEFLTIRPVIPGILRVTSGVRDSQGICNLIEVDESVFSSFKFDANIQNKLEKAANIVHMYSTNKIINNNNPTWVKVFGLDNQVEGMFYVKPKGKCEPQVQ